MYWIFLYSTTCFLYIRKSIETTVCSLTLGLFFLVAALSWRNPSYFFLKNWRLHECLLYWIRDNCAVALPVKNTFKIRIQTSKCMCRANDLFGINQADEWRKLLAKRHDFVLLISTLHTLVLCTWSSTYSPALPFLSCALRLFQHVLAWCISGFSFYCCSAENVISGCD